MTSSINSLSDLGKLAGKSQGESTASLPSSPANKKRRSNKKKNLGEQLRENKLKLSRSVSLSCYPVIATLKVMQQREDIATLLNEKNLPKRLSAYLKKIDIIDSNNQLTELGEKFRKTKQLLTAERGLYNIWYCHNDPLIDKRPVIIQRINAFAKTERPELYSILHGNGDQARNKYMSPNLENCKIYSSDNKQLESMQVQIVDVEVVCKPLNRNDVTLTWSFSDNASRILLNGNIKIQGGNHNNELTLNYPAKDEHTDMLMQAIAKELKGEWRNETKYLQLPLSKHIDNYKTLNTFRLSKLPCKKLITDSLGEFSIEYVNELAIQPLYKTEKQWQEAWLKHFYRRNHIMPTEADKAQKQWVSNEAIRAYDIATLNQYDTLKLLQEDGKNLSYWHAAASIDLVPGLSKFPILPLHFSSGEDFNFQEVITYLSGHSRIDKIIISDRYYQTDFQQEFLHELAGSTQCKQSIIFTMKNKKNKLLPQDWGFEYFNKSPENHDRYWLFISKKELYAWKVSTSLDFARRVRNKWQVKGYPSFIPVEKTELPNYLVDMLGGE